MKRFLRSHIVCIALFVHVFLLVCFSLSADAKNKADPAFELPASIAEKVQDQKEIQNIEKIKMIPSGLNSEIDLLQVIVFIRDTSALNAPLAMKFFTVKPEDIKIIKDASSKFSLWIRAVSYVNDDDSVVYYLEIHIRSLADIII